MAKEKPAYYGMLPAKVRYDNRLRANEKIMFTEITALANKNGYCSAGNNYFAELYEANKKTVSRWITDLKKCAHIVIEYDRKEKRIVRRRIYPLTDVKSGGIHQKMEGYPSKSGDPIHQKAKGNTTRGNTTRKNRASSEFQDDVSKVCREAQQVFMTFSPTYFEVISDYHKTMNVDLMLHGIEISKKNNKDNIKYLIGIYRKWSRGKVHTLEQLKEIEQKVKRDNSNQGRDSSPDYKSHDELKSEDEERQKEFERKVKEMEDDD